MPTPDIDIGELRRLGVEANAPPNIYLAYNEARVRYRDALESAAPALLAAAEEGERLAKLLSFDGCDADDVMASMPNKFPDALIVRRSWFEGERREELKDTENRYIEAMDEVQRLRTRLALAEVVVSAAKIVNKSHDHSTACLSAWVRGVDGCKCGLRDLASALSTYEGKSE